MFAKYYDKINFHSHSSNVINNMNNTQHLLMCRDFSLKMRDDNFMLLLKIFLCFILINSH